MPIVESTSGTPALASSSGFTELEAELNVEVGLGATIAGGTTFTPEINAGYELLYFEGLTNLEAHLTVPLDEILEFEGSTSIEAPLSVITYEAFEVRFVVDVIPEEPTGAYETVWLPRLLVSGVEVKINSATYTEGESSSGGTLTASLANPDDKSLFVLGASVEFAIGLLDDNGDWDLVETLFSEGLTNSKDLTIGWANNGPTDTVSITVGAELSQKLSSTPETDLVLYDSEKQTLEATDFETLYDTEGNSYPTELVPVAGLTLYGVFQRIFVTRCGFSSYKTNLPDYPVARVDCSIGEGYLQSIGGLFGIFSPVIFAEGSVLWIIDATVAMPSGFPAPRSVSISDYRALNLSNTASRLDGLVVNYTENKRIFDYVTTRIETKIEEEGPNVSTFIQRGYREYRKFSNPALILRDELYFEERTTTVETYGDFLGGEIAFSRETYNYDELGRLTLRQKNVQSRVPSSSPPYTSLVLQDTTVETESFSYAVHPYQTRSQYVQSRKLNVAGLIAVDSENQQFGRDFRQEYTTAYRAGNLNENLTFVWGDIRAIYETAEPKRGGQVKVKLREVDFLSGTVNSDENEERVGDVSIYGTQPIQNRVLVLDADNATRTTERLDTINVGELPLTFAIPLARRILIKRKTKSQAGSPELIGFRPFLRKGLPVALTGRGGEELGNFLITGRRIQTNAGGCNQTLDVVEI